MTIRRTRESDPCRGMEGDMVDGERCPECGGVVVYNGNYFCIACPWIMAHTMPPTFEEVELEARMVAGLRKARAR